MAQLAGIQAGTIGAAVSVPVELPGGERVDLTTATDIILYWVDSAGTIAERTPTVVDPATHGLVQYTTVAGDFAAPGLYQVQIYVASPTWTGFSTVWTQPVFENLTDFPEDAPAP